MGLDNSLTDFMTQALCAGDDEFHALLREGAKPELLAKSYRCKAVCAKCSVIRECMIWALHVQPVTGVWAGVNWGVEKERLAVRRSSAA